VSGNLFAHFVFHIVFVAVLAFVGLVVMSRSTFPEPVARNFLILLAIVPFFIYYSPDKLQYLYKIKYHVDFVDRHILFHSFLIPLVLTLVFYNSRAALLLTGAFALGTGGHCLGDFFSQAAGRGSVTLLGSGVIASLYLLASAFICLFISIAAAVRANSLKESGAPANIRAFAFLAITTVYWMTSRDLIPDNIPFTGKIDDLLVAIVSYYSLLAERFIKRTKSVYATSKALTL
jgi:uncharacterized membrane protein YkvA (DUF1232 family)